MNPQPSELARLAGTWLRLRVPKRYAKNRFCPRAAGPRETGTSFKLVEHFTRRFKYTIMESIV